MGRGDRRNRLDVLTRGSQAATSGAPGLTFVGGPDKVFNEINYRDHCGMGLIDLSSQQPSLTHRDVMEELDLSGREVLPRLKEL